MPLSLYSAWLQPMRAYGGGGPGMPAGGGSHLASYPSSQPHQLAQHLGQLGLNHLQGAAYPGHRAAAHLLTAAASAANFEDDSEDDGSMSPSSPVHDLSKSSQHGEYCTDCAGDSRGCRYIAIWVCPVLIMRG